MVNIENVIEKAYKNDKKISVVEIEKLNLKENEFELLINELEKANIEIDESIEEIDLDEELIVTNDSVRDYLKQIGKIPLLTKEEERDLFIKGDDQSKQKLIESNLRLVVSIAKRNINSGLPFDDLIQEGNIGLIKAIEKFDINKGFRISTYATWWIRQGIQRAIFDKGKLIKVPNGVKEAIIKIRKYEFKIMSEEERIPSYEEISDKLGYTIENIKLYKRSQQDVVSLETPVGEEKESILMDFVEDEKNTEESILSDISYERLLDIMKIRLMEREFQVLNLRFGLSDGIKRTLEEVGEYFEITRERVRQIEAKALKKMRIYLKRELEYQKIYKK